MKHIHELDPIFVESADSPPTGSRRDCPSIVRATLTIAH